MQHLFRNFCPVALACLFPVLAGARTVTFRVDMSIQMATGRYDATNDLLQVRGPFNDWGGTQLTLMAGSGFIYETVIDIIAAEGSQFDYKFFIGSAASGDVWEGNVGPARRSRRKAEGLP